MSTEKSLELGLVIYASVKPIFKIYFIIALGFYLARKNILTVTTCRDISDTIVTAIMPCLIFDNIVSNLKSSDIKNIGIICFTGTLLFLFGVILAWITYIVTKCPRRWLGGLLSVGLFPNISDLPIAYLQTFAKGDVIFTAAEGNKGVAYVCIFLMTQVFYQFSLGLYRLIEWDFQDEIKADTEEEEEMGKEMIDMEATSSQARPPMVTFGSHTNYDQKSISSEVDDSHSIRDFKPNNLDSTASSDETNHLTTEVSTRESTPRVEGSLSPLLDTNYIHRRVTRGSMNSDALSPTPSRTIELRKQKSQKIEDVIQEYSNFEALKRKESRRSVSGTSEIGVEPITSTEDEEEGSSFKKQALKYLRQMGKNLIAPSSISLVVSIAIAMSPPLKALFVPARVQIPPAPDGQPPLSFIIDLTSYIGAASVPLGLILLGATISRLQVKKMPAGFWKTALMITGSRLIVIPIIGVGITTGFYKGGWYGDDKLIRFVSVLEFGLPNATALVYFTAFYTDPTAEDHLQMDCLAICLICQYSILYITLPFLVTFTLKVSLGY
ncbi:Protein ECM3 [Spathaspora sp. JA1]|nr:Protein ECM3 [Spathaspora sp. JA1]